MLLIRNKLISNNFHKFYTKTTKNLIRKKICIVGAGPAGFYAAQYLLKNLSDCDVDVIEKLPVPFGLVRFGVAPDHPEVKNVINSFTKTAEHTNFRFLGNFSLGQDASLQELREKYHVVLLTYGAEQDRKLDIPNENSTNVMSARNFVAWYNGLPGYEKLQPNFNVKNVTLIGQGNVAIDVARILLSPVDTLKTTDITEYALECLSRSKIEKVHLVGRRGPLQAAFTIKELREMLKLPNVDTIWRENDFKDVHDKVANLQRPRKRLTELMLKNFETVKNNGKQFLPIFFRSPKIISDNKSIEFFVNEMKEEKSYSTDSTEIIPSELILRSIGYKSICVDPGINFDQHKGQIVNISGHVLQMGTNPVDKIIDKGLYAAGWLATGPTGVILTTMNGAFAVAKNICNDINTNVIDCTIPKSGLDITGKSIVKWSDWHRIDKAEIELGKKNNKPREKITDIKKMLEICQL